MNNSLSQEPIKLMGSCLSLPGYLIKAVMRGGGGDGGGGVCKSSCNLGGQSRNMLQIIIIMKTKLSES